MKKLAALLIGALLMPMSASAWDRSYQPEKSGRVSFNKVTSIEVFGWKSDLDGVVRIEDTGTDIDLDNDVSFNSENRMGLRITHVLNENSALELSYMKHEHSGNLTRAVTFDNKKFKTNAHMSLENSWLDLAWAYNLTRSKETEKPGQDAFYLDGMFGVKFSNSEISVSGADALNARLEAGWSESYPLPYLGLNAGTQISDNLWVKGSFKIIKVNAAGYDALHNDYNLNAALRLNPKSTSSEWYADLGYRGVKYDLKGQGDKAEIKYSGPTLGLFVRF
ncbi:MAG TPA: hypothetical protein PLM07_07040 [Candidatus Rifleibacterium sp.]|nr:hypothetical protein [Candidatus Rifleibacterium sp.]HPT45638.1 hypothetical protein [Candidatus Rifleibacterium sp.]